MQDLSEQKKALLLEIEKWSNIKEMFLKLKARANWIECGNANTK